VSTSSTLKEKNAAVTPKGGLRTFGKRVFWVLAICLLLELGLRQFGWGHYVIYRPDERLLWVPIPNQHGVTEIDHRPETINAQGFRYQQALTPDHPGIYRIFAFGDSATMGWGVADDEVYAAQLEKRLNSRACPSGLKFQVVSAGVNAYPQALTVERMKEVVASEYRPDAVILAYSFNTGFEPLADLQGADRQKLLHRIELKSVARRIAIYNFLIEGLLRNLVYYRLRERLMLGTWDTAASAPDMPPAHYQKELQSAKDVADAHHVPLVMLMLGSWGEFDAVHPYQKVYMQFAHDNNIPILNEMAVLRGRNQAEMYGKDPVHPSAAGHALIAQGLTPLIEGLSSYSAACQTESSEKAAVTTSRATSVEAR
jgi:lysophospholipase L1-like esterase